MLPSEQFFPKHTLMLSTLRKALVPAELAQHMQRLAVLISQRLEGKLYGTGKVHLLFCRSLAYLKLPFCRHPQIPLLGGLCCDTVSSLWKAS